MKPITLVHVESHEEWDLHEIEDGTLVIKDTESKHGGFHEMFRDLEDARDNGWQLYRLFLRRRMLK